MGRKQQNGKGRPAASLELTAARSAGRAYPLGILTRLCVLNVIAGRLKPHRLTRH